MTARTETTFRPPVMEARRWIEGKVFDDLPLINVSQAAPVDPPPAPLVKHMGAILADDTTHLYGPVLGLPDLRNEVAMQWSAAYGGAISAEQVGITSGCNQAFTAAISSLCGEGDAVILATPFYFNHKMWLDMAGVQTQALPCSAGMIPDAAVAEKLITAKTKAIVLVTPNNPSGVEYPSDVIDAFFDLAQKHGLALIVDETYRDFHASTDAPHGVFACDNWDQTLIHLYSFSKAFRLTGHRVGAIICGTNRMQEIEKFLDTVSICPNQLGQKAALWGLQNLREWLAKERFEILNRRRAIVDNFPKLEQKGWKMLGVGAYFCYAQHPFDIPSDVLCQKMVDDISVLSLPGTMFVPEFDDRGQKQLRIAFANINAGEITQLFDRLSNFNP